VDLAAAVALVVKVVPVVLAHLVAAVDRSSLVVLKVQASTIHGHKTCLVAPTKIRSQVAVVKCQVVVNNRFHNQDQARHRSQAKSPTRRVHRQDRLAIAIR